MKNECTQCGLCCRLFLVNLNRKEYLSGRYQTQFEEFGFKGTFQEAQMYGVNILKRKKNGACIYLKKNKCSIHAIRPQVCRPFFCSSKAKKFRTMILQIQEKRLQR